MRLADWAERSQQWPQYAEAANALVAARPGEAIPYGYRGDARRRAGDRAGARADFARALELDGAYPYARTQLIGMHLEDGEAGRAHQVLDRYRPSVRDDDELGLEARVCAARNQKAEAFERLRALLRSEGDDPGPLHATIVALEGAEWGDEARRLVEQGAVAGTSRRVATAFVQPLLGERDYVSCERAIARTRAGTPGRRQMLESLLEAAAGNRDKWIVHRVVRDHRDELKADVSLWGTTGYAYLTAGLPWPARRWLSDWPQRPDLQPWMLYNLVIMLWARGRERKAMRAGEAALAAPRDHTTAMHAVWLAVGVAASGDLGQAERLLAQGEPATGDDRMRFLWTMASAVVRLRRGEKDFAWFRREAVAARGTRPLLPKEPELARAYFLCAWRGGREAGVLGWLWAIGQWAVSELYRAV
jgi:Flp pilus assembly protein TadD